MLQNYEEIKNYTARRLATGAKTENFKLGDVSYKCLKLPAHDEYRLLRKLSYKTAKSVLPILKPLLAGYSQLQTMDLKEDVSVLLDTPIFDDAVTAIQSISEDDLDWLMDLTFLCIAKADEDTQIDLDKVLEDNPQHYFLFLYKFLEIQVGKLFMGNDKGGKKKKPTKQQMKLG